MRLLKLVLLFILPSILFGQKLSSALEQIGAQQIIDKGLTGKGVKVGIIDGGFLRADEHPSLLHHFKEKRVMYYKDFVTPSISPYTGSGHFYDQHGTKVWELIGGVHSGKKVQYGLATKALFYIARTDHATFEKREEEKYLIQALSKMIEQGVQIINISLGYTNGYSRKSENYLPEQMDGKSSWITRSIDSVLLIHDVLIIVSAGNEGDRKWVTLSAPADSRNVLTVGASKFGETEEMSYSSRGLDSLGYPKPDLLAYSAMGTSYSAPILTGLAACMLEYDSLLSPIEIKDLLIKSSNLFPYPNNYAGNGIPSSKKLLSLLEKKVTEALLTIHAKNDALKIALVDEKKSKATLYHKVGWTVLMKESVWSKSGALKVRRFNKCQQTTIVLKNEVTEIFWNK
jgi:subtilisin family serine protease